MSEVKFKIRPATMADAPYVATMIYHLHDELKEHLNGSEQNKVLASVMESLVDQLSYIFVATISRRSKEKLVGMGMFHIQDHPYKDSKRAQGEYLYVDPNYRNSSVGSDILKQAEIVAYAQGADEFIVMTKTPKFFERAGYKDPDFIFQKTLGKGSN